MSHEIMFQKLGIMDITVAHETYQFSAVYRFSDQEDMCKAVLVYRYNLE